LPSSARSQPAEPHTLGTGPTRPNAAEADVFHLPALTGPPEEAARIMFNHPTTLETGPIIGNGEPDTGTERIPLLTDPFIDGAISELSPPQIRHA